MLVKIIIKLTYNLNNIVHKTSNQSNQGELLVNIQSFKFK